MAGGDLLDKLENIETWICDKNDVPPPPTRGRRGERNRFSLIHSIASGALAF